MNFAKHDDELTGMARETKTSSNVQPPFPDLVSSSREMLQKLQATLNQQSQQSIKTAIPALTSWQREIAALGTASMAIANDLKNLPRTAQALAEEMPKLAHRLQSAGTRLGDAPRTEADIMGLFDKIPGTARLGASEWDIRVFLSDKHGSHIHPHSKGGGNGADNIVWEIGADNIRRGASTMAGAEQHYIRFYNAIDSILKNSTTIAKLGVTATGTAVLSQALVTALAYTLDLHRGEITANEFRDNVTAAAISAGIATPIFFIIFMAVMALFPEVVVILSAPAVVAGCNALFGVGITLPIAQSLVHHIEADGFGGEVKAQYEAVISRGETVVQSSSKTIRQQWQQLFEQPPAGAEPAGKTT